MNNCSPPSNLMHLIFDFDGTLVDSFSCALTVFNGLAAEHGFRQIAPEDIVSLRHMDSKTWLHHYQIPFYKLPIILHQATQHMQRDILTLQPFTDIPHILAQLHAAGYQLSIVSSNSKSNVQTWLNHHNLAEYFQSITHAPKYFDKAKTLKRILKHVPHAKETVCYIGDETRDIDAAKQTDISCMAVTWGFQAEALLVQQQPQYLVRTPMEILKIFVIKPDPPR